MKRREALKLAVGAAVAPLVPVAAVEAAVSEHIAPSIALQRFEWVYLSEFCSVRVDGMDFLVKALGPDAVIDCTPILHLDGTVEHTSTIHVERLIRATQRERLRRTAAGDTTAVDKSVGSHGIRIDA